MPTPVPGATKPAMTLEFFEEAAKHAQAANQPIALMPSDLLALCRMARTAERLDPDVRALASYGLQSAVPEVAEASRRVLAGRPSLPPLGLKPLDITDDRTPAQKQADGDTKRFWCRSCRSVEVDAEGEPCSQCYSGGR